MKTLLLLLALATCNLCPATQLTNVITGSVGDYGLSPQKRVAVTATLLFPNPRTVNNVLVRQDAVGTMTDTSGNFAFTNFQWGIYSLNIQGLSGTQFKINVGTNTIGTVPIASLVTNNAAFPPNPATNYYSQAQVDALLSDLPMPSIGGLNLSIGSAGGATNIDLQAILNSMPHSMNRTNPGGGTLELGTGIFYCSGAMWTNYTGVDSITIKGKGVVQTVLVFTNNSGLLFQGNGNNIGVNMSGLAVASMVDSNYFLVHVQNNNRSTFYDVTFMAWPPTSLGLEVGVQNNAQSTLGMSGLWYDGMSKNGSRNSGDNFTVQNCNFDALTIGVALDGDHWRLRDNFFEACNFNADTGDGPSAVPSMWPATNAFGLGGAILIGLNDNNFGMQDGLGEDNHFFECWNQFVDMRSFTPLSEIRFSGNQFEGGSGGILMRTNANAEFFMDGLTFSSIHAQTVGIIKSAGQFSVGSAVVNPNFHLRIGNHQFGSNSFDQVSSTNFIGDGSALTNLHTIKGISGTGFTVAFAPNSDGSSNATITVTPNIPTLAQVDAAKPGIVTNLAGLDAIKPGIVTNLAGVDAVKPGIFTNGMILPATSLPTIIQLGFMNQLSAVGFNDNQYKAVQGPDNGNGGVTVAQNVLMPGTYTNFYFNWMFPSTLGGTNCALQIYTNAPGASPVFAMGVTNFGPMSQFVNNGASNLFGGFKVGPNTMGTIRCADNGGFNISTVYMSWSIQRY